MAVASVLDPTPAPWRKLLTDVGPAASALFTQAADFKASGLVPTTMLGPAAAGSTTIPSTSLKAGGQYNFTISGELTAAAGGVDSMTVTITLGGTTIASSGSIPIFFGAPGSGNFLFTGQVTCRGVTGASGDFLGSGILISSDPAAPNIVMFAMMVSSSAAAVDVSAARQFDMLVSFNNVGPSITTKSVGIGVAA